jgi:hypothetical protein
MGFLLFSRLLVQAVVQAKEGIAVSLCWFSLALGIPLLDTLGVTGSSTVAPIHKSGNEKDLCHHANVSSNRAKAKCESIWQPLPDARTRGYLRTVRRCPHEIGAGA